MGEGIINFINYFSSEKRKTKRKADNVSSESNRDNISQDEIDKILDKISDSGYSSLSKKEKEKLFNASKK